AENLDEIRVNEIQIEQVVLNLMRNGLEAMAEGDTDDAQLTVRTAVNGGNTIQVTVEDAGPGMDAEEQGKIFEPFYTTKNEGMGMGLSICRSIVESHAGRLWVENGEGGGTRFHFTLPQHGG
ncbi:MAG: PAS domain-containing sensor histidine kinase, partial [Gammaproteobacteria bacterium]